MSKYKKALMHQFSDTVCDNFVNFKKPAVRQAYEEWLEKIKYYGTVYTEFLDELGINYKSSTCAEVGKCGYDAVTTPYNTKIITNYPETFKDIDENRLIASTMKVPKNVFEPFLTSNCARYENIVSDGIKTFMTQNPYPDTDIYNWGALYTGHLKNIVIGMYGSRYDYDKINKFYQMEYIKSSLSKDDYIYDSLECDDMWFSVLATKPIKYYDKEQNDKNLSYNISKNL